jgi:hypothetical protein
MSQARVEYLTEVIMYHIVWRDKRGGIIFVGFTEYKTPADADEAVRTLYSHRNVDCTIGVELFLWEMT